VIDPDYGSIEISAIILENGDLQIINPEGDTLQFSSIEEIPSDLVICNVFGCTDSEAINYNPEAIIDDGSCEYEEGCLDDDQIIAENFGDFFINDCNALIYYLMENYGYSEYEACSWDGNPMADLGMEISEICECACEDIEEILGCNDETACNYNNPTGWGEECVFPGDYCEGITIDNMLFDGVIDENCDCIEDTSTIGEYNNSKKLIKIIDLVGRKTTHNGLIIEIYNDGSVEKKYINK
jgi:hypothetical protein